MIPVNEGCLAYANELSETLGKRGFRTEVDTSTDSFNKKIRNAVTSKIPNIAIIGNKEVEQGTITLRRYCVKEQVTISKEQFTDRLARITAKRLMDNFPETVVE